MRAYLIVGLMLCVVALASIQCGPIDIFWIPLTLEVDGRTSKDMKIRLLDDKLELQMIAESWMRKRKDSLSLNLRIRLKSHDLENVVLQPDSIVVLYKDSSMTLDYVSVRKPSDTSSAKNYRISVSYYHPRKKWREFRANPDNPNDSWLKIVLDRFVKVNGQYVPIDTVFVAEK